MQVAVIGSGMVGEALADRLLELVIGADLLERPDDADRTARQDRG
jgi:hypothetical protein